MNNGVSRVLAALHEIGLAMKLTETAFTKASKRLADVDSSTLSQAQEKLATVLGFANHDAARKALKTNPGASSDPSLSGSYRGRRWLGLSYLQTLGLIRSLAVGLNNPTDSWPIRADQLLKAVLSDLFGMPSDKPVTAQEMLDAINLDRIGARYLEIKQSASIPLTSSSLVSYVDFAIGFSLSLTEEGKPQSSTAKEQHGFLTMFLASTLQSLITVEMAGLGNEKVQRLLGDSVSTVNPCLLLEDIESEVRFGTDLAPTKTKNDLMPDVRHAIRPHVTNNAHFGRA